MRCLIVDDDKMVRELLTEFISMHTGLELIDSCESSIEASKILRQEKVDLVFLDSEILGSSALELDKDIQIVFLSKKGKDDDGFDQKLYGEVTSHIVKPVSYARFRKAIDSVEKQLDSTSPSKETESGENLDVIFVKVNGKLVKVKLDEIRWIEAQGDYVLIRTRDDSFLVLTTMKSILSRIPENQFVRAHRKYIIRIDAIDEIEDMSIVIDRKLIPVGASHKKNLTEKLNTIG